MLLQVDIKGHHLLALLDTSSTHNFLHVGTLHRIWMTTVNNTNL
jgi:hypothetical protein